MTCKHNWNFVDGLTKRIRCTRCAAMEFVNPQDKYVVEGLKLHDPRPNNIIFYNTAGGAQVEVLRISQLGITANPDIPTDEAADAVLRALDGHIKSLVHRPWVGLTDEEVKKLRYQADEEDSGYTRLIKATEAKLKEKNTSQDGDCKHCVNGCSACDARRQPNVLP